MFIDPSNSNTYLLWEGTDFLSRGAIDTEDVPIAGLNGVSKADGLTIQTFYDNDLTDNIGLASTAGLSVAKLGGGTYNGGALL